MNLPENHTQTDLRMESLWVRELEILEKIASAGHSSVVVGEKNLADNVLKLI